MKYVSFLDFICLMMGFDWNDYHKHLQHIRSDGICERVRCKCGCIYSDPCDDICFGSLLFYVKIEIDTFLSILNSLISV